MTRTSEGERPQRRLPHTLTCPSSGGNEATRRLFKHCLCAGKKQLPLMSLTLGVWRRVEEGADLQSWSGSKSELIFPFGKCEKEKSFHFKWKRRSVNADGQQQSVTRL